MTLLSQVRSTLVALRDTNCAGPNRSDLIALLVDVEQALGPRPSALTGRRSDLLPALSFMNERGSIRSSGDLGRALRPDFKAERACSLGRTRLYQMKLNGWVVAHDLGGWSITDAGREAYEHSQQGSA